MEAFTDALDQPHVQLLMRLVLGGVLVLAGITKLSDRPAFRTAVSEYEVLPAGLVSPFAAAVPWLELMLGVMLLFGLGTAAAAGLAMVLFLSFSAAIGINLARGRDFNCHCFGTMQSDKIGWPALIRSAVFAAIALFVALGASGFGALDAAITGSTEGLPPAIEVLPVVLIAFVVIDVLVLLPETLQFQTIMQQARSHGRQSHGRQG
jgi:uncharacterized membrane protein YphA (DoxX/SURF4 family)